MDKGIIPTLDSTLLKLLKTYNFAKNNQEFINLAKDLEENERALSNPDEKTRILEVEKQIHSDYSLLKSHLTNADKPKVDVRPVRIYMDGVFDIIHSGHFNAIRQSKKLGDILVVGVNSDAEVEKAKGPTLMNQHERAALVRECKWADEVIEDTPYTPTLELLDQLKCDYCAHGDDMPLNENGDDCYAKMKNAGRMRVFKRTEGISTTDIIGRLLTATKDNRHRSNSKEMVSGLDLAKEMKESPERQSDFEVGPVVSNFLTTSWRLVEFSNNRAPKPTDKIVYIDGAFDILHIGHIETLKAAKARGDFLYVGLHDDNTVNKYRGRNYPILNLQERVLNMLSLKCVDDVIIGAPWIISEDLIKSLRINFVVEGSNKKTDKNEMINSNNAGEDPYAIPKKLGIYSSIESKFDLDNEILIDRILENRSHYIKKYTKKKAVENDYYQKKEFVEEH